MQFHGAVGKKATQTNSSKKSCAYSTASWQVRRLTSLNRDLNDYAD
jgi:hypothetical protein